MAIHRYSSKEKIAYWKTQLPVDYLDDSLTINDWENVVADLSGGLPAKLWFIMVEQTNNGAAAEDIELEITLPHPVTGVATAYIWALTMNSGTPYFGSIQHDLAAGDFSTVFGGTVYTVGNYMDTRHAIPFSCKDISLIRVRQTSAVDGVSAQIEVNIVWDKLVTM